MSQIEELKVFVSERLHAAASEILGAFVKTITDYEEQAARLKEENDRHRSLLDIILKAKLPKKQGGRSPKSTPAAAGPGASDSSPAPKGKETPNYSSGLQCVFTSRTDLLKLAGDDNCPYCLKSIQATETHLMRKHYPNAVHFTENGTEKFVIPCTCRDLIQGRSHWHCPFCAKIIYRKCNFEAHISKQHGYAILQQSPDAVMDQPPVSAFEGVPLSLEPWSQQQDKQASRLLQVKEEEEVSHPEWQNSVQLQIKDEQIQKGDSQMSVEADQAKDPAFDIVIADSYIQDLGESNSVECSKGHPLPNSSTPLETQPDSGDGGLLQPAGESQHTTPCSSVKALNTKRKVHLKRSLPPLSLKINKSTKLSVSRKHTGPHSCKACGKTFHYMYTLRTHAQTHAVDKIHICGICGKHLASKEGLVQHLQSHTKRNKCGICGKHFSNNSRLKRHSKFHRPKGLNVMSSA
ncbi:zinc finger protein Gfi-1b-like [Cottoperca gobio]|uniref:Zinc finger protein Gfi-1b-like n=1 Tax=Cottoperca gobio TaxID=56716 RepID=A0A6J2QQP3_COTGO|nr:zinc finger protein Gfi-1b-like [Cottoperca gobio]